MDNSYYSRDHLKLFPEITSMQQELGEKFFSYYGKVFEEGALSAREKSLIALAVAHAVQCPYCIDAYTSDALQKGSNEEQMMEAVHVAAAIRGGATLVHGVQMMQQAKKNRHVEVNKLSLLHRGNALASSRTQLQILSSGSDRLKALPRFHVKLSEIGLDPLQPSRFEILQINLGKMCNQTCRHCHVDAGPDRKEIMPRSVMEHCLSAVENNKIATVDLTGGAPELNPEFRWLITELSRIGKGIANFRILDRCNLTIILANPRYADLPQFFANNQVTVVSSLPYFEKRFTDRQRGEGVFEKSIQALQMLNAVGYGITGSGLELDLVYNPSGAFLPGNQAALEKEFRTSLRNRHNVEFNRLFCLTNLPISRFLEFLLESDNLDEYMQTLVTSFNAAAARDVMCRNTISVGWDGTLYDCDFNQMIDLPLNASCGNTIADFNSVSLAERNIVIGQHCYGCTAGAGSSCSGALSVDTA